MGVLRRTCTDRKVSATIIRNALIAPKQELHCNSDIVVTLNLLVLKTVSRAILIYVIAGLLLVHTTRFE